MYRLTGSTGSFGFTHHYNLNMKYSPSGNIVEKDVTANTYIGWVQKNVIYSNAYQYNDRPHTVSKAGTCTYNWDLNGNMVQKIDNNPLNHSRNLWWDEENRLASTADYGGNAPNYLSVYIYNAGGDRVWKVAGVEQTMLVNGQPTVQTVNFNKTLYCGAYMVMDDHQYTKHYFIEGERVCTKIGGGFPSNHIFRDSVAVISGNFNQICKMEWEMVNRVAAKVCKIAPQITIKPQLLSAQIHIPTRETNMFFYHSDHLGSSSFITDAGGDAIQHLQYLPFGESFVDERHSSPYYTPYKFSGKEKDDETGFSYFGARYYDSGLSVWLSVDPLAGKYPGLSCYMYCGGNPVVLMDPDGRTVVPTDGEAFKAISNGLTPEEAKYVTINNEGVIDCATMEAGMQELGQVGGNYSALLCLVQSEEITEVSVKTCFEYQGFNGDINSESFPKATKPLDEMWVNAGGNSDFTGTAQGENYEEFVKANSTLFGITNDPQVSGKAGMTLYKKDNDATSSYPYYSTNFNTQIIINSNCTGKEQAKFFAHEAYGHDLFKVLGNPHSHGTSRIIGQPGSNDALEQQIIDRENEAVTNYNINIY